MPNFNTSQGELADIFVSDFELVDRYVGNQLWSWGYNSHGQLGDSSIVSKSSPVQTVSGNTNWKLVSSGELHTAAIKNDNTLWLWGNNAYGQLGDNSRTHRSSPVQTISGGTNWKQVDCGRYVTGAVKTDGTLWLWGDNTNAQLGTNNLTHRSSPVQTVSGGTNWKQVSFGAFHTTSIKTDGTLWVWGSNIYSQLGDNTLISKSSPVQTAAGGNNWKLVCAGAAHNAAIKTDGTLWLWGSNGTGEVGDNTIVHRSSPVQVFGGGTNWKQVSCGYYVTAAIKTDGTLWLWGYNGTGELGDGTRTNRSSPVQTISGGTNWKQTLSNKEVSSLYSHTAAIKTDGTLWGWGYNGFGQLGDNTIVHRSSPVQTVAGGTNWKQIAGSYHTVAVKFTEF